MSTIELKSTLDVHFYLERSFSLMLKTTLRRSDGGDCRPKMVPANQRLSNCLTGLLTPQTGVIKIDGENFNDLKPVEKLLNKLGLLSESWRSAFQPWPFNEVSGGRAGHGWPRHDYEAGFSGSKKLAWMIKQLKVHMTCHCRNASCWALQFWQWSGDLFIWWEPMMSLDWESRRWPQFFLSYWFGPPSCDYHPWLWIGRRRVWVAYVMEHGKFGFAGSPLECPAITNLSSEWDYYHRGLWNIAGWFADIFIG